MKVNWFDLWFLVVFGILFVLYLVQGARVRAIERANGGLSLREVPSEDQKRKLDKATKLQGIFLRLTIAAAGIVAVATLGVVLRSLGVW